MKKLLILLILSLSIYSDTIILQSEKLEEKGNVFWILTACKDGCQYTITKSDPTNYISIVQDFEKESGLSTRPIKCQMDFKHLSQLPKD